MFTLRSNWLYVYLVAAMAICLFLGNMATNLSAQGQNANWDVKIIPDNPTGVQLPKSTADNEQQLPPIQKGTDELPLLNYSAGGDAFYLDKATIKPAADGKLYYETVGKNLNLTNGKDVPTQRATNMVDCNTGSFLSQTSRTLYDTNGNVIMNDKFENVQAKALSRNSALYGLLKDACAASFNSGPQW